MAYAIRKRGEFEWAVVEEKGVHERDVEVHPSEAIALDRMRALNAQRAQEAMGTAGTFFGAPAGGQGCTCRGMRLDAVPCPVHHV